MLGHAAREGVAGGVMGMRQVIDGRKLREEAPGVDDAADRDAAEADAVIAALAPDQPGPLSFAASPMIGERDIERRVDRLRARTREEDAVEPLRRHGRKPCGEFEGERMAIWKVGAK